MPSRAQCALHNDVEMKKRVVVTGLGLVTPLGVGTKHVWSKLTAGQHGFSKLPLDSNLRIPSSIVARVPIGEDEGQFNASRVLQKQSRIIPAFAGFHKLETIIMYSKVLRSLLLKRLFTMQDGEKIQLYSILSV